MIPDTVQTAQVHRRPVPSAQCPSLPGGCEGWCVEATVGRQGQRGKRGKRAPRRKDLAAASTKGASVARDCALCSVLAHSTYDTLQRDQPRSPNVPTCHLAP